MDGRFEEFLRERKYLLNVSEATLCWYRASFKAWERFGGGDPKQWVVRMREEGLSPVSINTYICGLNVFWKWAGDLNRLQYLKEEQKILATLSNDQVTKLINFKPKGMNLRRAHVAALVILDTGVRASELIGLTNEAISLDDLVIKVRGKGGKHRLVPFSYALRKHLFVYAKEAPARKEIVGGGVYYFFGTKYNTKLTLRNFERDIHVLGEACGIRGVRFSPHTLRHSFAANWIRRGGDIFLLSKCLGHSDVSTTTRYLRSLGIEEIRAAHQRVSMLGRAAGIGGGS